MTPVTITSMSLWLLNSVALESDRIERALTARDELKIVSREFP